MSHACHSNRTLKAWGPSIGTYQGRDIPAWIESGDGRLHDYVGVSGPRPDLDALGPGQCVIAPGLIYQERGSGG